MPSREPLYAEVEPSVISWAFNTSGWKKEELVKKLGISQELFDKWLSGKAKPTIKQLDVLSKYLKRPLAAFFLSEPPPEPPQPKDYRMLPDKKDKFDRKTLLAIRKARRLQEVSRELSENLDTNLAPKIKNYKLTEEPKKIAEIFRNEFGFNEEIQKKIKNSYNLFNLLRDSIEDRNIFVFQISMPLDDARGFSLIDGFPAIIIVNSRDSIEARVFTLMHEFGHIVLNEPGISMPENLLSVKNIDKVEKWCNEFSSSFLFPEALAKSVFEENKERLTAPETLNFLSNEYKLSKAMLLYNMNKLGYISYELFNEILERYKPQVPEKKGEEDKKAKVFGKKAEQKCISENGQKFVSLVATNVERGLITHSDALSYLSIKLKNLDKVISKAKR